jgi:hypothetical protein
METRISDVLTGLVLGGSAAVGGAAVVRASLYAVSYVVARSDPLGTAQVRSGDRRRQGRTAERRLRLTDRRG